MNVSVSAIFFFLNSFIFSNFQLSCQLTNIGTARSATKTLLHMGNLESRFFKLFFCGICFFICLGSWRVDEVHRETPAYSLRKMRVFFQKSVASGVIDSSAYTRLKLLFFIDTLVFVWNWSRFPHRHAGNQGFLASYLFIFRILFVRFSPWYLKAAFTPAWR